MTAPHSGGLAALISTTRQLPPLMTAVVYPCGGVAIAAALEAAAEGVIEPILIGPRAEITRAAAEAGPARFLMPFTGSSQGWPVAPLY